MVVQQPTIIIDDWGPKMKLKNFKYVIKLLGVQKIIDKLEPMWQVNMDIRQLIPMPMASSVIKF